MKYIFTCLFCGKSGETNRREQKYCGTACRQRYRRNVRRPQLEFTPCPYNAGVDCRGDNCFKCGWNPEVEQKRREKMGV